MDRLPYLLSLGALGFLGYFTVVAVDSVGERLDEMEKGAQGETRRSHELAEELVRVHGELVVLQTELESSRAELADTKAVATRLETIGRTVELQRERLELVARVQDSFDPETIDASLKDLGRELTERWEAVYGVATSAAELAGESRKRLDEMNREGDHELLWQALMGPVVQLAGTESVGSGVLVRGPQDGDADAGDSADYVLTAWHVVRDIQGSLYNRDMPVPVAIYVSEGETRNTTALLLDFDADIDIALLQLEPGDSCEHTVRLPSARSLDDLRIFDAVYAVGCPLGNDPIPTVGQIAATHHEVDGETYMMINAPTYVGNSGGGIFAAGTHELLGIFSKVYTHGALRPTIVTHMGLVTPMSVVYAWLEAIGYGFLITPDEVAAAVREASVEGGE